MHPGVAGFMLFMQHNSNTLVHSMLMLALTQYEHYIPCTQNTLWPEVRKLYGHGDNLYCASAAPDGALIASACVAKSTTAALIWVWDTRDWKPVAQLAVSADRVQL